MRSAMSECGQHGPGITEECHLAGSRQYQHNLNHLPTPQSQPPPNTNTTSTTSQHHNQQNFKLAPTLPVS